MAPPRVSIRLATDGKAQVVRDFADVGDAGDMQAKRISAAYQRAANDADASLSRVEKAAQRMAAVGIQTTPMQAQVNSTTGVSQQASAGAAASAAAIAAQMAAGEQAAQRLLSSVDPLYAAQMRYNQALAEAEQLQRIGILTSEQFATVQGTLKAELEMSATGLGKNGLAANNARIASMELEHAVRGSADAFAAGMDPARILAMHLGMLGEAAQLSGGSFGKFGAFMSGPWGIALTVGVMALGPLIGALSKAGEGSDDLVDKLKKESQQARDNDQAHKAFSMTLDGVTDALKKNREALDNVLDGEKSAAEKALASALAQKARLDLINKTTQALINQAKAQLELNNSLATGPETKSAHGDPRLIAADAARSRLDALQATLPQLTADLTEAQREIDQATAAVMAGAASKDPVTLIKDRYKSLVDQATKRAAQEAAAARAAGDQAKAQQLVTVELQKQVVALDRKRDAEVKSYEDAHKKPSKNAGGTAIFDQQIASFFDIATKYKGDTSHSSALQEFFKEAHVGLDPEKSAWCAAFVNAVLAAGGAKGTGSMGAPSFLKYGKDDIHSPQRGDIVVLRSPKAPSGDHVGFLDSIDAKGNVRVLSGNSSGGRVSESTWGAHSVLAIRRPPTPSEASAMADKAETKAQTAQTAFDDELKKLRDQYLAAEQKMVQGADVSAAVQLQKAQTDHDAEAKKIATNLAEDKYGDATSKLAQARAAQLTAANDAALKEQQAAIAQAELVKSLQALDAKAQADSQLRVEGLQFLSSITRTSRQRRDLELEIIDIQFQEKQAHLENLKHLADLAGKTEDAAKLQDQINALPQQKAEAQYGAVHNNLSPGAAYLDSLPKNLKEVNQALEKDGVEAWQKFNDGLLTALTNSKSLGDFMHNLGGLFHDSAMQILSDLIRIGEQEALVALFGKKTDSSSGGGLLQTIIGAIGNIGSAVAGSAQANADYNYGASGGYDAQNADLVGGLATGTEHFSGGLTWVGENGKELVRLPKGSKVYNHPESRRMTAANDGAPNLSVVNHNDFRGADADAVAAITERIDQMERDLPARVVQTYQDARTRFVPGFR